MAAKPQVLTDMVFFDGKLLEDDGSGVPRLRGVFQRCDTKNANGRIYPRSVWEAQCRPDSPFMSRLSERAVIGHLEHPSDGVTSLKQSAVLVTGISLDEKGQIIGEAEILPTPDGKIVQTLVERGVRIGISSRGKGSVGPDGRVGPDFALETFDVVNSPSTPGAYPKPVEETDDSSDNRMEETEMTAAPAPAATLDPKVQAEAINGYTARVNALVETDVSVLPRFQVSQLTGEMTSLSVQLGQLAESCPAARGAVTGLQNALNEKRGEITRQALAENWSQAEEDDGAPETAEDGNHPSEDVADRVTNAAGEIHTLRGDLENAQRLYDSMCEALSASKVENDGLKARLAEACRIIESLDEDGDGDGEEEDGDLVEDAVNAVLEVIPDLESIAQDLYNESETPRDVFALADATAQRMGIDATEALEERLIVFDTDNEDDDEDDDEEEPGDDQGEEGWDDQPSRGNKLRNTRGRVSRADRQTIPHTPRAGQDGRATALPDTGDFSAAESLEPDALASRGRPLAENSRLSLVERIQTAESGNNPNASVTLAEAAILNSGGV